MTNYSVNNKEYLISVKPSFKYIPTIIIIALIIVSFSIFYFKTYDIYKTKGYLMCDDKCNIIISVNIDDINKVLKPNYIKLNDEEINYNNISVGDIQVDDKNKINIQNVNIEVNQLDNDKLNTIQDVKIYSNYESIFNKIKKIVV